MASDFPRDIMFDILSRLPADNLIPLRSVCKLWNKLIRDPDFIELHQSKWLHKPPSSLILAPYTGFWNTTRSIFLVDGIEVGDWRAREIQVEYLRGKNLELVGSCNGLICMAPRRKLVKKSDPIFICNPITGEGMCLPKSNLADRVLGIETDPLESADLNLNHVPRKSGLLPNIQGKDMLVKEKGRKMWDEPSKLKEHLTLGVEDLYACQIRIRSRDLGRIWFTQALLADEVIDSGPEIDLVFLSDGFGFDHATKKYKVLRILWYPKNHQLLGEVITLGESSWRKLEIPVTNRHQYIGASPMLFLNGFLYWIGDRFILVFDIGSEKFGTIKVPFLTENFRLGLRIIEGSLALVIMRSSSNSYGGLKIKKRWRIMGSMATEFWFEECSYDHPTYIDNLYGGLLEFHKTNTHPALPFTVREDPALFIPSFVSPQ